MIAPIFLAAQLKGTLNLSATTGAQARSTDPAPIVTTPRLEKIVIGADLFAGATAGVALSGRRWNLGVSYSALFTIQDIELGRYAQTSLVLPDPAVFALGGGGSLVLWHDRLTTITFSEVLSGASVRLNTAFLYPYQQATERGQPAVLPTVTASATAPVGFIGSSVTGLGVVQRPARRVTLSFTGAYEVSGGLDHAARTVIPAQYGPRAGASLGYAVSRTDTLGVAAGAADTTTDGVCPPPQPPTQNCKEDAPVASLRGTLGHRISSTSNVSAAVGVGASVAYPTAGSKVLVILPVGVVTYTKRFVATLPNTVNGLPDLDGEPTREQPPPSTDGEGKATPEQPPPSTNADVDGEPARALPTASVNGAGSLDELFGASTFAASASIEPSVDFRTGLISNRLQATASLGKRLSRMVLGGVSVAGAQSLPFPVKDPYPLTTISGGVDARVRLTLVLELGMGVQELWQSQSGYGTLASSVAYLALTAREPPIRLFQLR